MITVSVRTVSYTHLDVYKRQEEELAIANADREEAELLNLHEGDEVMITRGSTYVNTFEPLEYFEITAVTSFYRYRSVSTV